MSTNTEFKCKNCGKCCGPVPFSPTDRIAIKKYLATLDSVYLAQLRLQQRDPLTCQYRDNERRICVIHPVRPELCKMQGFYEGLPCPYQPEFATEAREAGYKRLVMKGAIEG